MNIKEQNIYTDLFFTRPQRVLDILNDNITHYDDPHNYIDLGCYDNWENYVIPLELNRNALSAIMDVDKYIVESAEEYDDSDVKDGISLSKLFNDFENQFGVSILINQDNTSIIYVDEEEFAELFQLTYQAETAAATNKKSTDVLIEEDTNPEN